MVLPLRVIAVNCRLSLNLFLLRTHLSSLKPNFLLCTSMPGGGGGCPVGHIDLGDSTEEAALEHALHSYPPARFLNASEVALLTLKGQVEPLLLPACPLQQNKASWLCSAGGGGGGSRSLAHLSPSPAGHQQSQPVSFCFTGKVSGCSPGTSFRFTSASV